MCTVVAAVILSFSVVVSGKVTSPATFYATAGGIAAAFISVFWSFGYIRLSEKLRKTANAPAKVFSFLETPMIFVNLCRMMMLHSAFASVSECSCTKNQAFVNEL